MRFFFKPLLLVVTAFNVFLFVSLFGHQGEGRPILAAYLNQDASSYRLSELLLLQRVVSRIETDYVDPDRIKPGLMLDKAIEQMQREIPEIMFTLQPDTHQLTVQVDSEQKTVTVPAIQSPRDVVTALRLGLEFVEQHLNTDVPLQEVEYAAINGILSTLDPHSIFLPPEVAREMDVQIQGEFGGLGITISLRGDENLLTVINTLPDTPAARAGLKAGDQILQIEDESTVNMSLNEAVSRLRGPVGSPVSILLNRSGWGRPKILTIRRETIKIDSIESYALGQGVGYIHVKTFQHNTSTDLAAALDSLRAEHGSLKGLVLDLRDNPGGPLPQAIEVTDRFVDSGVIVTTVKANNRDSEDERAIAKGTEEKYPMVVIVDSESASASEIVAGALKNLDRATIIGEQTFGKGSVQNLYPYPDDAKLKLTVAKYLTPGRKSIQSVGITPDIRLVPVYFDKKVTYLYSTGHLFREKDLDSHFEESEEITRSERTLETIRYYNKSEFRLDDDPEARKQEVTEPKKPDPREDFQVQFARDFILKAGRASRSASLAAAKGFLKTSREARDQELQTQFAQLGIDWTQGKAGPVELETSIKLGESGGSVQAGQQVQVVLTVTNKGKHPASRVRAITDCELGTFKDLEFLLGRIEPGESRSWSREVKVPGNLYSLAEPMKVKVFESGDTLVSEVDQMVQVEEQPHPLFAYTLVPVDDGSGRSRGNGDGRIQRGEDIDLLVLLHNIGRGKASKAFAKLQNKSGRFVYLKTGTANLKEVAADGWVAGRMHFQVKDGLSEDVVRFDFFSGDGAFLRRPKDEVVLPVEKSSSQAITAADSLVVARKGSVAVRSMASDEGSPFAEAQKGSVLKVTGKVAGWLRVQVPLADPPVSGWVKELEVEAGTGTPSPVQSFAPRFSYEPPLVSLPIAQRTLPESARSLELKGEIRDAQPVNMVYVFVNNKKRYLRPIPEKDLKLDPSGVFVYPLTFSVPLEAGSNTIELYARNNDKLQSLDVFQVYRAKPPVTPAVSGKVVP